MAKPLRKTHRTNSRNCIAILTLTFAASINPLFAQTSKISMDLQNSRAQIGALEVKILGKEFQTDSDITRIRRLEHLVFPKDKPNTKLPLEQRIAKVLTIVTGQENSIREGSSMERHFLERRKQFFKTNSTSLLQQSNTKPVGVWEHKTPTLLNATTDDNKADVVLILLDCSNSMKSYSRSGFTTQAPKSVPRQTKLDVAKSLITSIAQRLPTKTLMGLRTLGAPSLGDPFLDCKQSKLEVPLDRNNRRGIIEHRRDLEPVGLTPLEFALRQAAESDLAKQTGNKHSLGPYSLNAIFRLVVNRIAYYGYTTIFLENPNALPQFIF